MGGWVGGWERELRACVRPWVGVLRRRRRPARGRDAGRMVAKDGIGVHPRIRRRKNRLQPLDRLEHTQLRRLKAKRAASVHQQRVRQVPPTM